MKITAGNQKSALAFTLIELLVVISIVGLLAAMIVAMAAPAMRTARLNRATTEIKEIETALESYQSKKGFYPPDNAANPAFPQLFYELTGTMRIDDTTFYRLHGNESIPQGNLQALFGVDGIVNSSKVSSLTNAAEIRDIEARDLVPNMSPAKYFLVNTNGVNVALLGLQIDGPNDWVSTTGKRFNPWHYVSSNPTNNPGKYDLWIDLIIRAGKTNRICNWSDVPIVLN